MLAGYSRLVIDLNRQPGDPQSILAVSDGVVVPGNVGLDVSQQEARAEAFHWPYHHAVDQAFARLRRIGPEPLFFSVHTFTPSLAGEDRRWDLGVLWNRDPRLAVPLIDILREQAGLQVGDNEPYSGRDLAYTLNLHAASAGLAHCAIEVRQDHCESEGGIERFADLVGDALERILAMPNVHSGAVLMPGAAAPTLTLGIEEEYLLVDRQTPRRRHRPAGRHARGLPEAHRRPGAPGVPELADRDRHARLPRRQAGARGAGLAAQGRGRGRRRPTGWRRSPPRPIPSPSGRSRSTPTRSATTCSPATCRRWRAGC